MTIQELIKLSGTGFGTSGVRGLEIALTDEVCGGYTKAFLSIFENEFVFKRVALGMDFRPSSPRIMQACSRMIKELGFEVDFCGVLPTPALANYAQEENIPAIMITGSHIPFDRNGMKFYRPNTEITKNDEFKIINSSLDVNSDISKSNTISKNNTKAIDRYEARYENFFKQNALADLKIGLYEHSSVSRDIFRNILEKLGATVISLERSEDFVPIDTEAVSFSDIERGLLWSKKYSFDSIISTDGDGDRPLISDENGKWLRGDIVGLLCADYLNISQVVVPISCNTSIEKSKKFDIVTRTRIGSPFVLEGIKALDTSNGTIAGFEANGGFILATEIYKEKNVLNPLLTRDALLPILTVLSAACEKNCSISYLVNALPKRFTASDRLQNFAHEKSMKLINSIISDNSMNQLLNDNTCDIVSQDTLDGLRLTMANHEIIHLRPSGNAPELRCYVETDSELRSNCLIKSIIKAVEQTQL